MTRAVIRFIYVSGIFVFVYFAYRVGMLHGQGLSLMERLRLIPVPKISCAPIDRAPRPQTCFFVAPYCTIVFEGCFPVRDQAKALKNQLVKQRIRGEIVSQNGAYFVTVGRLRAGEDRNALLRSISRKGFRARIACP